MHRRSGVSRSRFRPILRVAIRVAAMLVVAFTSARAERYGFDQSRCLVAIPDSGWRLDREAVRAGKNILLAARQNDGSRTALLMAMPLREKYDLETQGMARSVTDAIAGHATIVRIDTLEVRGLPARLVVAREHRGGDSYTLATAANGFLYVYSIYARTPSGGAFTPDPVSLEMVRGFDFIGLPEVDYVASRPGGAYAWVYRVVGIILFLLLAGIAGFLLNRRARRKGAAPAAPRTEQSGTPE